MMVGGAQAEQGLTELLKHLVTLVENEMLDVFGVQDLVTYESVQAAGGGDDDVGAGVLVAESLGVLGHRCTTVEGRHANQRHVLRETSVLVANLEGKLSRVTEHNDGDFAIDRLQLLERGEDEDSCLSVTRLCLAQDIHAEDSLRDTLLLNCTTHQLERDAV